VTPLVSVITPTWRRHGVLLGRCIPSVQDQVYPHIEHVIVSDGPAPELERKIASLYPALHTPVLRYAELPEHDPAVRWGLRARLHALTLARGEVIAYLDDDDAWRPGHVSTAVAALEARPDAGFGWTRMAVHFPDGTTAQLGGRPSYGRVATSMMFHRRELLQTATWQDTGLPDWDLAERWLMAGAGYAAADAETADYYRQRPDGSEGEARGQHPHAPAG
jgi:glycosyltransferase involved in cell wall biosynthesis